MVDIVKVKSGSPYEELESFSRVVVIGDWILVSNTAGVDYATQVFPESAAGQAQLALKNIRGALESVGSSLADVVRHRVIVPNPADSPEVMAEVGAAFRGIDPVSSVTCSPLGGPHYRVQIEVTAFRGAGASPQKRVQIQL
jgi:enamine deaminase RidA (YjgF/YER057c/UK114 family)